MSNVLKQTVAFSRIYLTELFKSKHLKTRGIKNSLLDSPGVGSRHDTHVIILGNLEQSAQREHKRMLNLLASRVETRQMYNSIKHEKRAGTAHNLKMEADTTDFASNKAPQDTRT